MLFSVCIPVYNTSKYLDECLQSVLCQTETDYEIVLVDDGSTDDSGKICDCYAEQYPHIRVIHKENEGLMMTRRRGFQEAKGDYCLCLDSDDYWLSDRMLSRIREMIEEKQCDLVLFDYIAGKEDPASNQNITLFDHTDGYVFEGECKKELYEKLLIGRALNAIWCKVPARHIVDVDTDYSQWKESLVNSQGEDLFQSLPILDRVQRVAYLKEHLYFYRCNAVSISRNVRPDYYYAYRTVYQRTDEYLKKWDFSAEEIHRIMQHRINMIFGILLAEKHPDRRQWLQVLQDVADDPFFGELWQQRDPAYVCRYYRLAGNLILTKRLGILRVIKKIVDILVRLKKARKRSV